MLSQCTLFSHIEGLAEGTVNLQGSLTAQSLGQRAISEGTMQTLRFWNLCNQLDRPSLIKPTRLTQGLTRGVPYQRAVSADFVAQHHANVHAPKNAKASTQGLHVLFNMHMLYYLATRMRTQICVSQQAFRTTLLLQHFHDCLHLQGRRNLWHKSCRLLG